MYLGYRAAAGVANALPRAAGGPMAETAGRLMVTLQPRRRRVVARNLERVTGRPLRGVARWRAVSATFASYGRYWLELFRLTADARGGVSSCFEAEGFEHVAGAIASGRGAIAALPHLGGFDVGAAWLAEQGYAPTVVVEPVEPAELFRWFTEVRRAIGVDVVPLGPGAGAALLRAVRANRVVCLLCDRDLVGDGVPVTFFGEPTTMPGGPAALALRTGAPLIPVGVYFRRRGGHHARIGPPVPVERRGHLRDDVVRVTQDLACRFEELVRAAPEQWHVMQPNWPSDAC